MEVNRKTDINIRNLSVSFDGIRAVLDLSFEISTGSIVALIGPNGAGKTTVFNTICGYVKPDYGKIKVAGKNVTGRRPEKIAQLGVGRTFQECKVLEQMSVLDNVLIGMRNVRHETMMSALWHGKGLRNAEKQRKEEAFQLLLHAGIADKSAYLAGDLSYGQRKLLELCRLQAFSPQVYLLDEPFSGLFPNMAKQIAKIVCELREEGKTIIFIEHDMQAVEDIANRVIVMDFGHKIAEGTPQIVLNDPAVLDAYLGKVTHSVA